jgi:serine/threonine protein kinase
MELDELVAWWKSKLASGERITPEEACAGSPQLLDDFRRKLAEISGDELSTKSESKSPFHTPSPVPPQAQPERRYPFFHSSPFPGDLGLLADYRILKELGRGGMGFVFLAEEQSLRRAVALKVMKPEIGPDEHARARFVREAHSAARLHCDHIMPVFRIGEENGILFIAMPLLPGRSLEDYLKTQPIIPLDFVYQVASETALGLAVAHENGLLHRDIKPANLWLEDCPSTRTGTRIRILDFGLARSANEVTLTDSGALVGTPGYMSPEQINGEELDGRTDLFSLGCVLYRLATGKRPFDAKTVHGILLATGETDPVPPLRHRRDIPEEMSGNILKLLAKKPEGRFQSARAVAAAFRGVPPNSPTLVSQSPNAAAPGRTNVEATITVAAAPNAAVLENQTSDVDLDGDAGSLSGKPKSSVFADGSTEKYAAAPVDALIPERLEPPRTAWASKRGRKLFLSTAIMLALLGVLSAVVLYPRSLFGPRFLTMAIREYQSPLLPPNAWAIQDGRLLAPHFGNREDSYDKQNSVQFARFLDRLLNWNEGPLVVHLCALSRVYDEKVVLFLGDTNPDEPSRGVPLQTVLDHFRGHGGGRGDRLLLLDIARPIADPRLGVMNDDVADAIHRELSGIEWPIFVLTACSPGQVSHVSEELGSSVFAHSLDLGLRGFAEQTKDRRITVTELAEFVKTHVDRWVGVNRGQRQTPRLYGNGKDFELVVLGDSAPALAEAPKEKSYPAWLKAGWKARDDLYNDGSYRAAPWAFRQLERAAAHTEKQWRSGANDDDNRLAVDFARIVANYKDMIVQARGAVRPRAVSLAGLRDAKTDALVKDHQFRLDRYLSKVDANKDGDKLREEESKKLKAGVIENLKKLPFDAAASAIVEAAARQSNLTPAHLSALVELLAEIRHDALAERRFAESVYLERLKDFSDRVRENGKWNGQTARLALRVSQQFEEVLADFGHTPSGFDPWNKTLLMQGESQLRRGDKAVFTGVDASWLEADGAYRQAEQTFRVLPRRLEMLRNIEASRDQALVYLPGWSPCITALSPLHPLEDDSWQQGMAAARVLTDYLERKSPDALDGESPLDRWQRFAAQWQKLMDARLNRLFRLGNEGRLSDYLECNAFLEGTIHSAEQRERIWTETHKLGLRLTQSTPPPDATDAAVAAAGVKLGDDPAARREKDRANRRISTAIGFLELASIPQVNSTLQNALALETQKRFFSFATDRTKLADSLLKADHLSRIFPDAIVKWQGNANAAFRNPALELHRLNQQAYWSYVKDHYQKEALDLRSQKSRHESFYTEAAEVYARALP